MDCVIHGVAKSQTQLSDFLLTFTTICPKKLLGFLPAEFALLNGKFQTVNTNWCSPNSFSLVPSSWVLLVIYIRVCTDTKL